MNAELDPGQPAVHGTARLNLREHLALVRSILSNERTFLAYQRTALTQLALAVTFIHFFDHPAFTIIGWLLIPISFLTIGLGVLRYRRIRALVRAMEAATRKARADAAPSPLSDK